MRIGLIASLVTAAALCMGASCPTVEPLQPAPLGAPQLLEPAEITGHRIADAIRPCVRLRWTAPDTSGSTIQSWTVVRKRGGDSTYSIVVRAIPAAITELFDPIDEFQADTSGTTMLNYRVFATDHFDRSGDSSVADTIMLQNKPLLVDPSPDDTLSTAQFNWKIYSPLGGYHTYMFFWDTLGHVWQSPRPSAQAFPVPFAEVNYSAVMPDSILKTFGGGLCFWGARIEVVMGARSVAAGGLVIRRCYVR